MSAQPESGLTSSKRAGAITLIGQTIKAIIQLAGLVIFSHLLTPRDIGLLGMLVIFLALGEFIRDFGLTQAAIQTDSLTRGQATNLFWTSTAIGLTLFLIFCAATPAISHLYKEPVLQTIAPWVAMTLIFNGLQAQLQVKLIRDHRFIALTTSDAGAQFLGLVAGIIAALLGATYWALVIQMLTYSASLMIFRASTARWWPGLPRRGAGMSSLYRYGAHSGLSLLITFAATNTDSYIVGVRWGAGQLGIYNRAFGIFSVPSAQLLTPLTNVILRLLSQERQESGDFYPLLWKAYVAISTPFAFIYIAMGALAEPLVSIALGPGWSESAIILSILSLGGILQVNNYIAFWAFLASGKSQQLLMHSLVTKPILVLFIVVGSLFGIPGVAWGFFGGLVVTWFIGLAWLRHCDGMPAASFLSVGLRVLSITAGVGVIGYLLVTWMAATGSSAIASAIAGFVVISVLYVPLILWHKESRSVITDLFNSGMHWARSFGQKEQLS